MPQGAVKPRSSSESTSPTTLIGYLANPFSMFSARRDSDGAGSRGSDRRDSESSRSSDRRGSTESYRRDSGGSQVSERRDSESSDRSDDTPKKKGGIFRHLIKWGSPHKSHKKKGGSQENGVEEAECNNVTVHPNHKGTPIIPIFHRRSIDEVRYYYPPGSRLSTSAPCAKHSKCVPEEEPEYCSSADEAEESGVSTNGSSSGSCSESASGSEIEKVMKVESPEDGYPKSTGSTSTYYSYFPDYRDIFRTRSQSLEGVAARRPIRRRRNSENQDWANDGSNHKTYTIYESTAQDGPRRFSLHSHRPSDVQLDPAHAAILFRDSRGLPSSDPFLERILNLREEEENEILVKFFKFHKCYDLIPTSAKLVVFDTQLLVKKAFFALVYNGVRAAPLWDSSEREFVGMLTITDFIRVLHAMYHDSAGKMSELEEHRVDTWRERFLQDKQPLIFVDPDASLYDAICSLVNNRIHRLPVIDQHTGNVLHILTHKRILKFLFLYVHEIPRPSFMNKCLRDVKIGTFDGVETAREDTPIIQALQKFLDRRVSALPIVDDQNRLLDIYARFDVINLAAEKTYNNLDITLKQANEHRNEWFEGVHKCTLDDTLYTIMEKIVKAEVHRLVVVDEQDQVVGIISLSDILQYLVMRPELKEVTMADVEAAMCNNNKEGDLSMRPETPTRGTPEVIQQSQHKFEVLKLDEELVLGNREENERENPTIIEEEDEKT